MANPKQRTPNTGDRTVFGQNGAFVTYSVDSVNQNGPPDNRLFFVFRG
jgi:hypothetical protein